MTDLPKSHFVSDDLFNRAIRIHLIGCGGTGSQLAPRLVQLHKALLALGHPEGLQVSLWDSDTVSESNPLRQNYFDIDVGHLKAVVMTNRINIAFGMDWKARPEHFTGEVRSVNDRADIVIGCVDTKSSRRAIDQFVRTQGTPCYWIDSGNGSDSAQIIVGHYSKKSANDPNRLPLLSELYPDALAGLDDNTPSCSARESLASQGLATNALAASWIYAWLATALRYGKIDWSGIFVNLLSGRASSIPVDPNAWNAINPNRLPVAAA
jgi:PRTRC genetic system ThiF family protein